MKGRLKFSDGLKLYCSEEQGMWAKIPVYLGVAAVCGAGLLYIAGLLLPETRSLSKTIVFDAPIDIVYRTVTDNRHWHYRTSPDDLRIVSENAGREV